MKKLFVFAITFIILIFVLTACGGRKSTDGTTKPDSSDATTLESTSDGQTESATTTHGTETQLPVECDEHKLSKSGMYCTVCGEIITHNWSYKDMVYFECDNKTLTKAYLIAINDAMGNVKLFKDGLLTKSEKCIIAGAGYDTPWTRDAAINVMNAFAFLDRTVSKNTLLSVLEKRNGKVYIGGQYWDAIIWTIGAYQYVIASGDTEFLELACEAVRNSLEFFEDTEFDSKKGLFRGPAVYGDGVAAYPDKYANHGSSGITSWADYPANAALKAVKGVGMPMFSLSTNCVYYESYILCAKMCEALGIDSSSYLEKAEKLKEAINKHFWNEKKGTYDYLAGECDYAEGMGLAFVILFGIAPKREAMLVLENTYITPNGIACVWPSFDRYLKLGGYGRHSGTIWPHIQGFWARAAFSLGDTYEFENELFLLAEKAVLNNQFHEIYHPITGEVYGGIQEFTNHNIGSWGSCEHQTWSATAYLSLIYYNILGADVKEGSVTFKPYLPTDVNEAVIKNFRVGGQTFDIIIVRSGNYPTTLTFDTTKTGTRTIFMSPAE